MVFLYKCSCYHTEGGNISASDFFCLSATFKFTCSHSIHPRCQFLSLRLFETITNAPRAAELCNAGKSKQLLYYSKLIICFYVQLFRNNISLCC